MNKIELSTPVIIETRNLASRAAIPALALAIPLASFVPIAVYVISHGIPDAPHLWQQIIMACLALAGCVFSAKSVVAWGYRAFCNDMAKAIGFAVLVEGTLVVSSFLDSLAWLGACALGALVIINVVSCASCLMRDERKFTQRKDTKKIVKKK